MTELGWISRGDSAVNSGRAGDVWLTRTSLSTSAIIGSDLAAQAHLPVLVFRASTNPAASVSPPSLCTMSPSAPAVAGTSRSRTPDPSRRSSTGPCRCDTDTGRACLSPLVLVVRELVLLCR